MHFALNDIKRTGRIKRVSKQKDSAKEMAAVNSFQKDLLILHPKIKQN